MCLRFFCMAAAAVLSTANLVALISPSATDAYISDILLGENCENGKATETHFRCVHYATSCEQETDQQYEICLGVEGGVVVITGTSQICFTEAIPTGCKANPTSATGICDSRSHQEFTQDAGNVLTREKKPCPTSQQFACTENQGSMTVSIPATVLQQLEEAFPGDWTVPSPFTLTATYCAASNPVTAQCPMENGPAEYWIVKDTCE